ncbi:hypothetical protein BaRGS_00022052 [Batillaria attramentaria]|uniref:Secreted protein n=1 Tax=Batillaria attramentaria TaxID=370345 RepID=A0ABD0KI87_9CAEN
MQPRTWLVTWLLIKGVWRVLLSYEILRVQESRVCVCAPNKNGTTLSKPHTTSVSPGIHSRHPPHKTNAQNEVKPLSVRHNISKRTKAYYIAKDFQ